MTGPPERRRQLARRALSHAAIALAAERGGIDAVSVDDIAVAGDVSRRTFFNYFPTKGDAVAWPLATFRERLLEELTARPAAESIWAALEASAARALADPAIDLDDLARAGRLIIGSPELLVAQIGADSVRALDRHVAARTGTDPLTDAYPQLVAVSAGTGIRVAVERWVEQGGPIVAHLAQVFTLIRSGLPDPRDLSDTSEMQREADSAGVSDSAHFSRSPDRFPQRGVS